jgi:hypothetical protein
MARACTELGQFAESWQHIEKALTAMEATGEAWCESDVHRTSGEIALLAPKPDVSKGEAHSSAL